MRPIHILSGFSLFACLLAFCGCSTDELPGTEPTDGNDATTAPFTITVTDGGYAAADKSAADTRAADNGYQTTFTAGDQIGLYIVKPDGNGTSYAVENICLTLTSTGDANGTLAWQAPTGTTLYYEGAGATYFAYYPYQQTLPTASGTPDATAEPVKPVASATDAAGFFAPLISAWTPDTDQGTHAKYTAQDLMIGSGTLGSKDADGKYSLSFSMTHAMALVVIETPTTKYTLTTDADYTWTGAAPGTQFYGFTPYSPSGGTYRYLVKPGQTVAADLYGSYTGSDGSSSVTKEYAVSPNGITAANYAFYKVDGATVITSKSHQLQAGDFYMSDGSLVGKDATLTDAQKEACVGVVYCVDNDFITNYSTKKSEGDYIHGLVVALKDASSSSTWGNAGSAVFNYGNAVAAPSGSSGWYLPNLDELKYICWGNNSSGTNGKDYLNTQFNKLSSGSADGFGNHGYWSSTEESNASDLAYRVAFSYGLANSDLKGYNYRVRSSLAF